jgi:hypothetical protein
MLTAESAARAVFDAINSGDLSVLDDVVSPARRPARA